MVLPQRIGGEELAAAREEIAVLLATTDWGSGFDGSRTRRVWSLLARTRCMDQAALDPVVLDAVEQTIRPGAQFSLTYATQVHPGQNAQMLHYEQGIYPLPRDRDVMVTAIWALDDFTAGNGATRVNPGSHRRAAARQETSETMPAEMPAGSVLLFAGRLWHGAGATPAPRHGSGSSSTTRNHGSVRARHTPSAPIPARSASFRSASRNYSASTSHRPTSGSSTAGTRANGCWTTTPTAPCNAPAPART